MLTSPVIRRLRVRPIGLGLARSLRVGLGQTAPASTVNAAASVGLDWNSIGATQQFQSELDTAASPDVQAQLKTDVQSATSAAISGQPLTDDQIKGVFVAAATGAAVVAGVSATVAASVFAPIAAVVFGGGYLTGLAIQKIFNITNHSPIACSPEDHTQYGTDPSDPKWKSYEKDYIPALLKPYGGGTWQPYTSGAFETWARPALLHLYDLQANCKAPPNVATDLGTFQFLLGLVNTWNAQYPNLPKRSVTSIYDDKNPSTFTNVDWHHVVDPIQWAMLKLATAEGKTKPNVTLSVANPLDPAAWAAVIAYLAKQKAATEAAKPTATFTPAQVVAMTALGTVAAVAAGGSLYALATHQGVGTFWSGMWSGAVAGAKALVGIK